jgi:hypothetical protein
MEDEMKRMPKKFEIKMSDLPNMIDALFVGDHDEQGWVVMDVNDKGRACVDALFPNAHIAWRDASDSLPADWCGFSINVPDVVAEINTELPLDITRGADLDKANPDALAFLLAYAVSRQGGRAAYAHDGCLKIVRRNSGH